MKVVRTILPYPKVLIFKLVDTPNIQDRLYRCADCAAEALWLGPPEEGIAACMECGGMAKPLGAEWWARASARLRAACRRNARLLGRIKAEWRARSGDVALPRLPEPFAWLNTLWAVTQAPGRPLDSQQHFTLAHAVDRLHSAHISFNRIFEIAAMSTIDERREAALALPPVVRRFLGEDLIRILEQMPFISDRAEFRRRLRWARRQWTDPRARLRGERVRSR